MVLAILLIAVLSISQILRYYFSYEDFSLLYGAQFPEDSHSIFLYPGFVAYLFLRPLVSMQYFLFGYNPFWYYLVSFTLFLLVLVLFYWFMRRLSTTSREVPVHATVIMASGYLGIESLTWNVAGGQLHLAFLIFSILTLILLINLLNSRSKISLTLFIASLVFSLYFFQFRSFLLFIWITLLVFFKCSTSTGSKKFSFWQFLFIPLLIVPAVILFSQSFKLIFGRITHLGINWGIVGVFLKNLGNVFFPSDLLLPENAMGILALLVLVLPPLYLWRRKKNLFWLAIFFSMAIIFSLAALMAVISFIGQIPTVWPSSHRFYIVLLPLVSGYLAVIISFLDKKLRLAALVIILSAHVYFSNYVIGNRWETHSRHLRYFYETVTTQVPEVDSTDVLLTTLTRPYPPGPFVSGSDAGSAHFLAGFYGKKFDDFLLATEPLEAVKKLLENNLTTNDIYAFDYKRDDIVNETDKIREILLLGKTENLGNNLTDREIEVKNLHISMGTPVFVKAKMSATPIAVRGQNKLDGNIPTSDLFELFFNQERERKKMTISSETKSMNDEHLLENVIDGKYDTTWIPQEWLKDGAGFTIDLGSTKKISQIVWASSRTAPWDFRQPSEFELLISNDGKEFREVDGQTNAEKLLTGEIFVTNINQEQARYVRLIVKRTRGGWLPAVDEVEVFSKEVSKKDLENYFLVRSTPQDFFPSTQIAARFNREILEGKVPVEINWRTDDDGGYLAGQGKIIYVEEGESKDYILQLTKTGRMIKSLIIKSVDFPSNLNIKNLEVWQPSLEEFKINKNLLLTQ